MDAVFGIINIYNLYLQQAKYKLWAFAYGLYWPILIMGSIIIFVASNCIYRRYLRPMV